MDAGGVSASGPWFWAMKRAVATIEAVATAIPPPRATGLVLTRRSFGWSTIP